MADRLRVEIVRGRESDETAEELLAFWARHGALHGDAARRRLPEVVCVVRDADGAIVGVNSVFAERVPLIGGRQFWIYRRFLAPGVPEDVEPQLLTATFDALAEGRTRGDQPEGLCVVLADPEAARRFPDAVWPESQLLFAGIRADGAQLRIRYFDAAAEGVDVTLDPGYRVESFGASERVSAADVLALWSREGVVPDDVAKRRVNEVLMVATDQAGELAGMSSAYAQRNAQIGMDLWHYRAFVAAEHRRSNIAMQLTLQGIARLERAFLSGTDLRCAGVVLEVENRDLERAFPEGYWAPTGVTLIGTNERGHAVRVRYFPGARAPDPLPAATAD